MSRAVTYKTDPNFPKVGVAYNARLGNPAGSYFDDLWMGWESALWGRSIRVIRKKGGVARQPRRARLG
ncbi:unnamed protein product [Caenorhabditis auriculariae]|uniref:Uncharacterized protein n=1 Tax=Caenorhabditis auriculariae TaxID=2777116 RepID=A0A8S1HSH3_9PELO|nr:unnamed protein product [Caenorhabditis auriculariae]